MAAEFSLLTSLERSRSSPGSVNEDIDSHIQPELSAQSRLCTRSLCESACATKARQAAPDLVIQTLQGETMLEDVIEDTGISQDCTGVSCRPCPAAEDIQVIIPDRLPIDVTR